MFREILSAELDEEATDEQLAASYAHLAECASCRAWRREIIVVKRALADLPFHPLPESVAQHFRPAGASAARGRRRGMYHFPAPLAWAAAATVILNMGWSAYQLALKPAPGTTKEIAETIVLTSRDRTSSTVMIRTTANSEQGNNLKKNGGQ